MSIVKIEKTLQKKFPLLPKDVMVAASQLVYSYQQYLGVKEAFNTTNHRSTIKDDGLGKVTSLKIYDKRGDKVAELHFND